MMKPETRRKEPRTDRDGRQYVAVHRNYLGLVDPLSGSWLGQVLQCVGGRMLRIEHRTFLKQKDANAFVRMNVGPGKTRAAMTAEQHAERLGWIRRESEGLRAFNRRNITEEKIMATCDVPHKVVVRLSLLLDDVDLESVTAAGFSNRRRAKLSEVKRWAEVTLLGQLQLTRERRAAELAGERTGR